jgi:UDP-2,4-diacetamido-2,4,6-trideoxy-beta-L-altropyranose hydrolase
VGEGTLLIRADASVGMGTGHVMRGLALAQAWQDAGGHCIFAMAASTPAVEQRLKAEGMEVEQLSVSAGTPEDARHAGCIAGKRGAAWIVVDGYQFGSAYQSAIKSAGFKVLFVDDNVHAEGYTADLVLNQNIHATPSLYAKRDTHTRLLLGPRYAMLRREFRGWRNWRREVPTSGRKILVTMGGSDPNDLTKGVIEAIRQLANPKLETVVLMGGSNPHLRSIEASIQKESMRLVTDATNMPELMTWADVAVAGAGTTFWEMCFLGLPGILLVLAENQEGVAVAAEKMGVAWNLGRGTEVNASAIAGKLAELLNSHHWRTSQSGKGRRLVDGRGAERVAAFVSGLELRRTAESDCEVFWEWANDPEARAASFRSKPISWEDHAKWFRGRLADPKAILYTATNKEDLPVGEVRYQMEGKRAVLSISLGARFRGCGWGQKILTVATERLFEDSKVEFIDAYVKPTNDASLNLFTGAGFAQFPPEVIEGQEGIHFVLERSAPE